MEEIAAIGACVCEVTAIRDEVRARSGECVLVEYNIAVGVEVKGCGEDGIVVTVEGLEFSRSFRLR